MRKAEILFDKEIEAVSAFALLRQEIYPQYSHPEMEWEDACNEVIGKFDKIHSLLERFLAKHGAAIKADIRKAIYGLDSIADQNKFVDMPGGVDRTEAEDAASKFLRELSKIEDQLMENLRE